MERLIYVFFDMVFENYLRKSGCFFIIYRFGGDVWILRFNILGKWKYVIGLFFMIVLMFGMFLLW